MATPVKKGKTAAAPKSGQKQEEKPGQGESKGSAPMSVENMKFAATALIALIALATAYYFLTMPAGPASPVLGSQVNMQTFTVLLSSAQSVYVVMDVRNATGPIKQNIIACGVDFAGSPGLGNKNMTFFSLDSGERCIGANGNYSSSWCFGQMGNGMSIIIRPGNSTSFYTGAMVVGMGENYTEGECSVGLVAQ